MHEFFRSKLSGQALQQLYAKAAFSNFVGYVAGSCVTLLTTYQVVERRAVKNLFGLLPREKVTVHVLPEWLEWALSILLGYLVMEFVRYILMNNRYRQLIADATGNKAREEIERPTATG